MTNMKMGPGPGGLAMPPDSTVAFCRQILDQAYHSPGDLEPIRLLADELAELGDTSGRAEYLRAIADNPPAAIEIWRHAGVRLVSEDIAGFRPDPVAAADVTTPADGRHRWPGRIGVVTTPADEIVDEGIAVTAVYQGGAPSYLEFQTDAGLAMVPLAWVQPDGIGTALDQAALAALGAPGNPTLVSLRAIAEYFADPVADQGGATDVWRLLPRTVTPPTVGELHADLSAVDGVNRDLSHFRGAMERCAAIGRLELFRGMFHAHIDDAIEEQQPGLRPARFADFVGANRFCGADAALGTASYAVLAGVLELGELEGSTIVSPDRIDVVTLDRMLRAFGELAERRLPSDQHQPAGTVRAAASMDAAVRFFRCTSLALGLPEGDVTLGGRRSLEEIDNVLSLFETADDGTEGSATLRGVNVACFYALLDRSGLVGAATLDPVFEYMREFVPQARSAAVSALDDQLRHLENEGVGNGIGSDSLVWALGRLMHATLGGRAALADGMRLTHAICDGVLSAANDEDVDDDAPDIAAFSTLPSIVTEQWAPRLDLRGVHFAIHLLALLGTERLSRVESILHEEDTAVDELFANASAATRAPTPAAELVRRVEMILEHYGEE